MKLTIFKRSRISLIQLTLGLASQPGTYITMICCISIPNRGPLRKYNFYFTGNNEIG